MSFSPFSRIPQNKPATSSGGAVAPEAGKGFGRKFTFRASFAGLLASGIILIIALGWVFAFGVIVGRGYDPEKKLPELARLLPPQSGAEGQAGQNGQDASEGDQQKESVPTILRPEDLTFMTVLKQRNGQSAETPATASGGSGASSPARGAQTPQPGRADRQAAATPALAAQRSGAPALAPAAPPASEKGNDKKKYDFVFQTAAFRNSSQADTLRERLEGEGLRTKLSIEKDAKGKPRWYRVQVILRGSEADAENAMQVLGRSGLKDARVVSKNSAGRGR